MFFRMGAVFTRESMDNVRKMKEAAEKLEAEQKAKEQKVKV